MGDSRIGGNDWYKGRRTCWHSGDSRLRGNDGETNLLHPARIRRDASAVQDQAEPRLGCPASVWKGPSR